MSPRLSLPSPAKLNLFLHILGQHDSHHELQTLFRLIDLCDELHFESRSDRQIHLTTPIPHIDTDKNLILKAAYLLQEQRNSAEGANISIHKRIPWGAGLGGGSSNAATTLLGLNKLWNFRLDTSQLLKLGKCLGADVPLFINGHTAWGEGFGERLQSISLPPTWYVIIKPTVAVSTAAIFQHPDLPRSTARLSLSPLILGTTRNDCETVVCALYPEVQRALAWLSTHGPARLTGTGSCVFLPVTSQTEGISIVDQVPQPWDGMLSQGLNLSPTHLALQKSPS